MRKTLFSVLCLLVIMAFAAPVGAANAITGVNPISVEAAAADSPTVCFIVDGVMYKKTPELLVQKLPSLIEEDKCTLISLEKSREAVKKYQASNNMVINQYCIEPLHASDALLIARSLGCDYTVFIQILPSDYKIDSGLLDTRCGLVVTCRVRVMRISDGKVVMDKSAFKRGTSNAIYMGSPSLKNSYSEGLSKALDELATPKIIFPPVANTVIRQEVVRPNSK